MTLEVLLALPELLAGSPEQFMASVLTGQAQRYCAALSHRQTRLVAVDRFYRDIMAYQWRLDAIASQMRILDSIGSTDADLALEDEESQRQSALTDCLAEIDAQHSAALDALQERAASYALCSPAAATGCVEGLATGETERQSAIEVFHRLAKDTYEEIREGAREILQVSLGNAGLQKFRAALEHRQDFWHSQMEDTWTAWQEATQAMHRAGDEAVDAWGQVAGAVDQVLQRWQLDPEGLHPTTLQALATAAARSMEAELVNTLGLSGLAELGIHEGDGVLSDDKVGTRPRIIFSSDARLAILADMIDILRSMQALHLLGEALLVGVTTSSGGLISASCTPQACAALLNDIAKDVDPSDAVNRTSMQAPWLLVDWLSDGLIEAVCEAARVGDPLRACALLELCRWLGGIDFANKVRESGSRAKARRGSSPLQLAVASGHDRAALLLNCWPHVEDADWNRENNVGSIQPSWSDGQVADSPTDAGKRRKLRAALFAVRKRLSAAAMAATVQ